jgi:hypothetical protein
MTIMMSVTNNVLPAIKKEVEPITTAGSVLTVNLSCNQYSYSQFSYNDFLPLSLLIMNKRISVFQLFAAFQCRGDRTQPRGCDRLHSPRLRIRANGGICNTVTSI